MATHKCTYAGGSDGPQPIPESVEGLEKKRDFRNVVEFVGPRAAVLGSGLVPAGTPVPGDGGSLKTRKSFFHDRDGRRYALAYRTRGRLALEIFRFAGEREARRREERAEYERAAPAREQARQRFRQIAQLRRALEPLPASEEQATEGLRDLAQVLLSGLRRCVGDPDEMMGRYLEDSAVQRIDELGNEIWRVVWHAQTIVNPTRRLSLMSELRRLEPALDLPELNADAPHSFGAHLPPVATIQ